MIHLSTNIVHDRGVVDIILSSYVSISGDLEAFNHHKILSGVGTIKDAVNPFKNIIFNIHLL